MLLFAVGGWQGFAQPSLPPGKELGFASCRIVQYSGGTAPRRFEFPRRERPASTLMRGKQASSPNF
ncbi:hypothetical protein D3C73_1254640 [compost metagenome]